jgi:ABC-2 type transport system ATP-binding protein
MSIEIKNISKEYGSQKALNDVSFSVSKGEIVGFLGPNGAGKSTLMKIITGFLPPTYGEVFINGEKITVGNIAIRREIGYLPENNPLYSDLYIREFLEITADFYHLKDKRTKVEQIIETTGIGKEKHKKIGALSKGYRQRVGLAQALLHDPQVLILDEPTTGLDPNQLEEIRALIRKVSKEKTVILSTHIMQEVEAICSRVLIINSGKVVADGKVEELKTLHFSGSQQVVAEFARPVQAEDILKISGVAGAKPDNNRWLIEAHPGVDLRSAIFDFAVRTNNPLLTLQETRQSLESVFQMLTR